jgi:hypothetical protein
LLVADKLINFRIPIDWVMQINEICEANGITFSEWGRAAFVAAINNTPGDLVITGSDGYQQARRLAAKLAHELIDVAKDNLPATYEEAVARFGFTSHAPEHELNGERPDHKAAGMNPLGRPTR